VSEPHEQFKRGTWVGLEAARVILQRAGSMCAAMREIQRMSAQLDPFAVGKKMPPPDGMAEYESWLPTAGDIEIQSWGCRSIGVEKEP